MQFQGKLINKTWEIGKKPNFMPQIFLSGFYPAKCLLTLPEAIFVWIFKKKNTNEPNLRK